MKNFTYHKLLTVALAFPILFLIGMIGVNEYNLRKSKTLVLPVQGYDPRDLLSGHYLIYKVDYGLSCPDDLDGFPVTAYMCFEPKKYIVISKQPEKTCSLFIKGQCLRNLEFQTNASRYYIPEKKAKQLEQLFIKADKKNVILSVTKKGHVLVKDLIIDGKSIKTLIEKM